MTTSQKQHNSPTRGWVACKAVKRDCRYGGDQHRTVQISSNLEGHSAAIHKSAEDGVIDAQETKDLSKSIADSVFSPKEKKPKAEKIWKEITSEQVVVPDEIPQVESRLEGNARINDSNRDEIYALSRLNKSITRLNTSKANFTSYQEKDDSYKKSLEEDEKTFTEENFEESYAEGFYEGDTRDKAKIKSSFLNSGYKLKKQITELEYKEVLRKNIIKEETEAYVNAKEAYNSTVEKAKKREEKTVRLGDVNPSYFETVHSINGNLDIGEYNGMIRDLQENNDLSLEDKIKGVHGLRADLIETAKANYRANKRSHFIDTIGDLFTRRADRLTDEEKDEQNKNIDANHAADGLKLAKFTQNLKKAPWDSIIER